MYPDTQHSLNGNFRASEQFSAQVSSLCSYALPGYGSAIEKRALQFDSAFTKFGAQLFLTREHVSSVFAAGKIPSMLDVHHLHHDAISIAGDFDREGIDPSVRMAIRKMQDDTSAWTGRIWRGDGRTLHETEIEAKNYFSAMIADYSALQWKTVLKHLPAAQEMGILLLDFETRMVGVPQHPLRSVADLHNHLLVDPSKRCPQEGFIRHIPADELFTASQKLQSHLIGVLRNEELHGFAMLTLNHQSTVEILGERYAKLCEAESLLSNDVIGWVHLVGSSLSGRLSLARKGLNLYSLMTPLMKEIALAEGVNVLLGSVREGENANLSVKAHQRHGWQLSDCCYFGSDNATPYRVIFNRVAAVAPTIDREFIGLSLYGETPRNDESLSRRVIESAKCISDADALHVCEKYYEARRHQVKVVMVACEHLHIRIKLDRGTAGIQAVLKQNVPNLDQWTLFSNGKSGTLEEMLPETERALGLVYSRGRGGHY